MGAIFRHHGTTVPYTPGADVAAGDVVVQGELVGVANVAIPANTKGHLAVGGVFDFPKATGGGSAIAVGVDVFWDDAADEATDDPGSGDINKKIGRSVLAAADGDATVRVRMSQ